MTDTIRYTPALIPIARTLAQRGALDKDLAAAFGVHFKTIRAWRQQHPDFAAACRLPREAADDAVERALFRKATGYDRETERVFLKDGQLVRATVTEHVPPCDKAATFWLRVRRPDRWGPPPAVVGSLSDLTPTEETLRAIEGEAYDAWCDASEGQPEAEGDDTTLARIDALIPEDAPPADDGDPLQSLGEIRHPYGNQDPFAAASRLVGNAAAYGSRIESGMTKKEGSAEEHETLPHRHHPPLPEPISAPLVVPIDADPPAPMSKYDPAFIPIARQMAEQGALDRDLARAFGVSPTTLRQWTLRHAAFGAAVRLGKAVADQAVEDALFARAVGYSYIAEKVVLNEDGAILRSELLVQQPPSLAAARFWLARRAHPRWSPHRHPDLDPDEAARLIAETRERVAEYDLHRRHWRAHGCAPPGRDEPAPPEWMWNALGYGGDEEDGDEEHWREEDEALRARVDAAIAEHERLRASLGFSPLGGAEGR